MSASTMIREYPHGLKIEFRAYQANWGPWIEHRELKPDGTPHNESWYPISDAAWVNLAHKAPEILRGLLPHLAGSSTLTPRG